MKQEEWLIRLPGNSYPVVTFDPASDRLLQLDFTDANQELTGPIINDTAAFSLYISRKLAVANARYGIGGYNEHRTVYSRSSVFDSAVSGEEPRRLHLGTDIWAPSGTLVHAPLDATVHSFAFNDRYGDYGATIILRHELNGHILHTLYGHISLSDLDGLYEGMPVARGAVIAHFGKPEENGHWPPHLHFQLIRDMGDWKGDYPGVCSFSEREQYLGNCPNPDHILQMMQYAVA
jgi:murein DD-endopeptidase MepM/ murein hydrolase activator NlpD